MKYAFDENRADIEGIGRSLDAFLHVYPALRQQYREGTFVAMRGSELLGTGHNAEELIELMAERLGDHPAHLGVYIGIIPSEEEYERAMRVKELRHVILRKIFGPEYNIISIKDLGKKREEGKE